MTLTLLRRATIKEHGSAPVNNLAFVKETVFQENAQALTAILTPANTLGNLLVLCNSSHDSPILTVVDTGGNVWTQAGTDQVSGTCTGAVWYSITTAVSGTLTVTYGANNAACCSLLEFSGANATPFDKFLKNAGATSSPATGTSAATSTNFQVVVAFIGGFGTQTYSAQTAGYTPLTKLNSIVASHNQSLQSAYKIVSTAGTQAYGATQTSGTTWTAMLATFKSS